MAVPRKLSLMKFEPENIGSKAEGQLPFSRGQTYVFLGELENMPGHCVVVEHHSDRAFSGYHTDYFSELGEDEV